MQTNEKSGISLVVLAVTIIVLAILVTLIPITIVNVVNNAKMATFIKDLEQIQDGVDSYVITNGSIDGIGVNQKTQTELLALVIGSDNKATFESDLTSNGDYETDGTNIFYEIDLSVIGVDSTSTGLGTLGPADKYYVSLLNEKVYYPYGKKIGGDTYFSLTSRLTGKANVSDTGTDVGDITLAPTDDKIITKLSTQDWSNNIDMTVDTVLAQGEYLRYTIGGATAYTTRIDSLPATINLSNDSLEVTEKVPWRNISTEGNVAKRIVLIERMNAQDTVVSSKVVRVDNLDIQIPIYNTTTISSMLVASQGNYNIVTFPTPLNAVDAVSGAGAGENKEIRYDYLTKIDNNGNAVPYYDNNPTMDQAYLLKFGKTSSNMNLKIPENVARIATCVVDKAGNFAGVYDVSIGTARRANIDWTQYAKFNQTYNGRREQLLAGTDTRYSEPIIPEGFRPVEIQATANNPTPASWKTNNGRIAGHIPNSDYDKGLVIEDRLGNQFVWIPVTATVPYTKWTTQGDFAYNAAGISDGALPNGVSDERAQITKYSGFYVARYESTFDYNGGNIRAKSVKSINVTNTDWSSNRTSAYNGYLFNCVSAADAKVYAERMVNTPYVKSGLLTGTAYDTMLKAISTTTNNNISTGYVYNILDSAAWGNTAASTGNAATGAGTYRISGYSEWWKALNMYDIAGNIWEVTSEKITENGTTYSVVRGTSADDSQIGPAYRAGMEDTIIDGIMGFRAMLFIID